MTPLEALQALTGDEALDDVLKLWDAFVETLPPGKAALFTWNGLILHHEKQEATP